MDAHLMARAEAAAQRSRERVLAEAENPKRKPLKKSLPPEPLRRDNPIDVPESERSCTACGEMRKFSGTDISEVLELEPAKLYVRRDIRIKRACRSCEGELVRAPCGHKVVAGGQIGCIAAQILVDKYDLGLPLHRQRRAFARMGLALSPSTKSSMRRSCTSTVPGSKWSTELIRS